MRTDFFTRFLCRGTRPVAPCSNQKWRHKSPRIAAAGNAIVQALESRVLLTASSISSFNAGQTTITSGMATPVPVSNSGTNNSSYGQGVSIGGILYYSMDDGVHGSQIWRTDGTSAGTAMVTDIDASSRDGATPIDLTDFDGTLYFIAETIGYAADPTLYETDGTPNGTLLVQGKTTYIVGQIGNELYFTGIDSSGNLQLYKTDGGSAGTVLVPGVLNYNVSNLSFGGESTALNFAIMGDNLYVESGDELLKVMPDDQYQTLATFSLGDFPYDPNQYDMFATENAIYFTADNPNDPSQLALYKSDGTAAGTSILISDVADIGPDASGLTAASLGNELCYSAGDGLYRTDGTVAGTFDLSPYGSDPIAAGDYLYFTQSSDPYQTDDPTAYTQLWVSDGTVAGSRPVTPSAFESVGYSLYVGENTLVTNNSLYFIGSGGEIYQTDGTVTSWIDSVTSPQPANIYDLMGLSGNGLVFSADYAQYGQQLWVVSMTGALPPVPGWPPSAVSPPAPTTPPPPAAAPPPALIPTLGRVRLKSQVVAGSKLNVDVPVIVTNSGATMKGTMTVELFADTGTSLDGSQVLLSTKPRRASLKADEKTAFLFDIKSVPASLQSGDYHFVAEVIDPSGDTNTIATSQTVRVEARTVTPSVTITDVTPGTIAPGRFGSAVVTVTNIGDAVSTRGTLTLELSADPTNSSSGVTLKTIQTGPAIPAGKSRRLRLHFKVPTNTISANYLLSALVSFDGSSATATGSSRLGVS